MVFENGVKNIQAAAYNGARTVIELIFSVNDTPEIEKHPEKRMKAAYDNLFLRAHLQNIEKKTRQTNALYFLYFSISDTPEIEKHPEKRMKAAYEEFGEERLPQLKEENPSLRLSQLKQMLFKEWQKRPKNPIVAAQLAAMQQ